MTDKKIEDIIKQHETKPPSPELTKTLVALMDKICSVSNEQRHELKQYCKDVNINISVTFSKDPEMQKLFENCYEIKWYDMGCSSAGFYEFYVFSKISEQMSSEEKLGNYDQYIVYTNHGHVNGQGGSWDDHTGTSLDSFKDVYGVVRFICDNSDCFNGGDLWESIQYITSVISAYNREQNGKIPLAVKPSRWEAPVCQIEDSYIPFIEKFTKKYPNKFYYYDE